METRERQWVTMREASQEVGVSLTTLRDWYRSGAIDTRGQSLGRVIDLDQVRQMAMGSPRGAARRRVCRIAWPMRPNRPGGRRSFTLR
jgi:predicted site-specific integrase-resolvase